MREKIFKVHSQKGLVSTKSTKYTLETVSDSTDLIPSGSGVMSSSTCRKTCEEILQEEQGILK